MVPCRIGITVSPYEAMSIWSSNFGSPYNSKAIFLSDFSRLGDVQKLISLGNIENLEDDIDDILLVRPKVPPVVHNLDYWPQNLPCDYYYLFVTDSYIIDVTSAFDKKGWWICRIENEEPWAYLKNYSTL
jgi:hypothetical protein